MPSYSAGDVVLVRYPFSDLSSSKIRPAVVVNAAHASLDVFLVPLTSRSMNLQAGEFLLQDWAAAGLHIPTATKRGIYTVKQDLILKLVGRLTSVDRNRLGQSLREWLGLV
jgi:mRNA interferase MazF